ncbi:MAG TPA: DNA polymerase, partial [Nitrospira sp.]|nr:DNA polymerase [Nitrospira sp.]
MTVELTGTGDSGGTNTPQYEYEEVEANVRWREARVHPERVQQYLVQHGGYSWDDTGRRFHSTGAVGSPQVNRVDGGQRQSRLRDLARRDLAERPFIGWDGEGYTTDDGRHHYMLFGSSVGDEISSPSLGTRECLDLLLSVEQKYPDSFHVIFAGNYDVNMMLKDMPTSYLRRLKETGMVRWEGYSIGYIKSKMFRVKRGTVSVTLYDVFTFFATSFVKALEEYIGADDDDVRRIREGKSQRSEFGYEDLENVAEYFRAELRYLVRLCDTLRDYLTTAGIRLAKWHGPGAVASAVLKSKKLKRIPLIEEVSTAAQYAYTGGRFEQFKIGTYEGPVWQYDIRSAYPSAIATLPRLGGEWRHVDSPRDVQSFGLYRCVYESAGRDVSLPHPFAWRHRNGAVFYPPKHGGGWIWGVELLSSMRHAPGEIRILEGWEYNDSGERPYAWIAEMYQQRVDWKEQGNAAQLALKLAMNSIYGKLAQQVGWRLRDGVPVLPSFHQLEYAGYITAHARSQLYAAMMQSPDALIATETDAVYSMKPLELAVGKALGEWEEKRYDGVIYVQSGLYFARDGDEWKHRTRGFGRGDIEVERLRDWLATMHSADDAYTAEPFRVSQTRFKTLGTSLGKEDWRTWVTTEREISAGTPGGKREHFGPLCISCETGRGHLGSTMHEMVPALSLRGIDYTQPSQPFPLEWVT